MNTILNKLETSFDNHYEWALEESWFEGEILICEFIHESGMRVLLDDK